MVQGKIIQPKGATICPDIVEVELLVPIDLQDHEEGEPAPLFAFGFHCGPVRKQFPGTRQKDYDALLATYAPGLEAEVFSSNNHKSNNDSHDDDNQHLYDQQSTNI